MYKETEEFLDAEVIFPCQQLILMDPPWPKSLGTYLLDEKKQEMYKETEEFLPAKVDMRRAWREL